MMGVLVIPSDVFWVVVQGAVEEALLVLREAMGAEGMVLEESVFREARDAAMEWVKSHLPKPDQTP